MAIIATDENEVTITFANGASIHANAASDYVELDVLVNDTVGGYLYADNSGFYVGANSGSQGFYVQAAENDVVNFQFNGVTRVTITKDGITAPAFNIG